MLKRDRLQILLLTLVVLGYLLFYGAAWKGAPLATSDSSQYLDFSHRMVQGTWVEPHDRMPGYPLLLLALGAAHGSPGRALFYFQLLLHAGSVGLLVLVLRKFTGNRVLLWAFAAFLLLPPFTGIAAYMLTECVSEFLMSAMTYAVTQLIWNGTKGYAWLSGLMGGLAFLVKPVFLLLGPVTAILMLLTIQRKKAWRVVPGLVVPSLLLGTGYLAVNYAKFGYFGLTPKAGFMLFTRTAPFLERIPDKYADLRELLIHDRDQALTKRGSEHTGMQFMLDGGLNDLISQSGKSKAELSAEMFRLNLALIAHEPLRYLTVVAQGIATIWFPSVVTEANFGSRGLQFIWSFLHFGLVGLYAITLSFFVARTANVFANRHGWTFFALPAAGSGFPLECFLHTSIWYTVILSSVLEVAVPRYCEPILPLVALSVIVFTLQWHKVQSPANTYLTEDYVGAVAGAISG